MIVVEEKADCEILYRHERQTVSWRWTTGNIPGGEGRKAGHGGATALSERRSDRAWLEASSVHNATTRHPHHQAFLVLAIGRRANVTAYQRSSKRSGLRWNVMHSTSHDGLSPAIEPLWYLI